MQALFDTIKLFGGVASAITGILALLGTLLAFSKTMRDKFKGWIREAVGIKEINDKLDEHKKALDEHVSKDAEKAEQIKTIGDGMECMLRTDIMRLCNACISAKYITTEDLEALTAAFNSYESLGGNMFVHNYFEKVNRLEIRDDKPSLNQGF